MKKPQFTITRLNWLESIKHNFAAVTFNGFGGTLGLGVILQTIPDIEIRSDSPSDEPIGTFDSRELSVSLAYGKQLSSDIFIGVTTKYLYEKIQFVSTSGFAVDLGTIWQTPYETLKLAASLQNFGKMGALEQEDIKLPSLLRIGAGFEFPLQGETSNLLLTADQLVFLNGGGGTGVGAEYSLSKAFILRAGYQFGRENRGATFGFGTIQGRFAFDYGSAPLQNDLGSPYRLSVKMDL